MRTGWNLISGRASSKDMARPCLGVALALCGAAHLDAEETAPVARERAISPHMAAVLADAVKRIDVAAAVAGKVDVVAPETRVRDPALPPDNAGPANSIVRLPAFVVTERKLPNAEEVLTEKEVAKVAMRRFLGDETSLNRAMNTLAFKELWNRIPVLGRFVLQDYETNEERAMRLYRETKRAERWKHVTEMQALTVKPGAGVLKKP